MAFLFGLLFLFVGSIFADPFTYLGDLPLENPDLFGGDILLQDPEDRNAIVNNFQIWPGGIVPYEEDPGLKKTVMKFILERSFNHYLKHTCIKFVPRTNEKDYIRIFPGQGCYSYVGRVGGQQPVSLGEGCGWEGTIIHELGHALGFYHEQNRSDRDDYLKIYWENILEGVETRVAKFRILNSYLLKNQDYLRTLAFVQIVRCCYHTYERDLFQIYFTWDDREGKKRMLSVMYQIIL